MEIIYLDLHFLINLLTDYLLCLSTARFCGLCLKRLRYLLAALLGAAYSLAVLFPGLIFLASPIAKLSCALLICLIAYGGEEKLLRCCLAFLGLSACFGGAVWAVSMAGGGRVPRLSLRSLLLSFSLCYFALSLFFRGRGKLPQRPRCLVKLSFMGQTAEFYALMDSGNCLTDPVSGSPVMLVSPAALGKLLPDICRLPPIAFMEAAHRDSALRGRFRLIPFSSLGGEGMLPAFRPDSLSVDGTLRPELLAALSPKAVGEGFSAIV